MKRTAILFIAILGLLTHTIKTDCSAEAYANIVADGGKLDGESSISVATCQETPLDTFDEAGVCGKYLKDKSLGLCCKQDELKAYMTAFRTREKTRAENRATRVSGSITKIFKGLDKVIARLEKTAFKTSLKANLDAQITVNAAAQTTAAGTKAAAFVGLGASFKASGDVSATFFEDIVTELKKYKDDAKMAVRAEKGINQAKNCRIEYNKARAGAICIRASKAGSDFWDNTNKA